MISNATMINCKLKDVAQLRGYKNAKHLADAMSNHFGKNISYSTIYPLWNDTAANYARATLDKICRFLNVSPGVLIEYTPDEAVSQQGPAESGPGKASHKSSARSTGRTKQASAGAGV